MDEEGGNPQCTHEHVTVTKRMRNAHVYIHIKVCDRATGSDLVCVVTLLRDWLVIAIV